MRLGVPHGVHQPDRGPVGPRRKGLPAGLQLHQAVGGRDRMAFRAEKNKLVGRLGSGTMMVMKRMGGSEGRSERRGT